MESRGRCECSSTAPLVPERSTVKTPDWSRYEFNELERMLYSYRALARDHLERGHFALARWATKMCTSITIEMNHREMMNAAAKDAQLVIGDGDEAA